MAWVRQLNSMLNHDFCPSANRWVYWLKDPFWNLVLATLLSVVCGFWLNPMAFLLTAVLAFVIGIGVAWPWIAVRGLESHIVFDTRRGRVGQAVLVRLRIQNRWPWPVWGVSLVRGFAFRDAVDTNEGFSLARVPGWGTAEFTWPFVPERRGLYPLVTPEVETAFPFGLYRASRPATVDGSVVIWPETISLAGMPDSSDSDEADDRMTDRAGEYGDMLGTRPFRHGDSLRRVHWAQTARQQQLIVCERQSPATSSVRVLLDLNWGGSESSLTSEIGQEEHFELAVRVTASVVESLHRQHAGIELRLGKQLFVVGESVAGYQRAMDAIAMAVRSAEAMDSVASTAKALSRGFFIGVFSIHRYRAHQGTLRGLHSIVLGTETAGSEGAVHSPRLWISLSSEEEVSSRLPQLWKGACNVR
ncbi:MAG: DUF58 domain-containing protein [Planctomyces sp.]|nr:DUF58 domain-containing protein [Planctomyces sp.]